MYDIYQIQNGDTIDTLAIKYNIAPQVLRQLNPNSSFGVGTNIIVPKINEFFEMYTIQKLSLIHI